MLVWARIHWLYVVGWKLYEVWGLKCRRFFGDNSGTRWSTASKFYRPVDIIGSFFAAATTLSVIFSTLIVVLETDFLFRPLWIFRLMWCDHCGRYMSVSLCRSGPGVRRLSWSYSDSARLGRLVNHLLHDAHHPRHRQRRTYTTFYTRSRGLVTWSHALSRFSYWSNLHRPLLSLGVQLSPVYTIQHVVKPVWQPVVSCKRGITNILFLYPSNETAVVNVSVFRAIRPIVARFCFIAANSCVCFFLRHPM